MEVRVVRWVTLQPRTIARLLKSQHCRWIRTNREWAAKYAPMYTALSSAHLEHYLAFRNVSAPTFLMHRQVLRCRIWKNRSHCCTKLGSKCRIVSMHCTTICWNFQQRQTNSQPSNIQRLLSVCQRMQLSNNTIDGNYDCYYCIDNRIKQQLNNRFYNHRCLAESISRRYFQRAKQQQQQHMGRHPVIDT